jgi:DNA-binding LacI/PurR family transcriptional regulator
MHGQDRVRPSTRQRVLEVIEALGYVPMARRRAWPGSARK